MEGACWFGFNTGIVLVFFSLNFANIKSQEHRLMNITCEDGWVPYGGSCYKHFKTKRRWIGAFRACQSENSYLADIDSDEELDFLINLAGRGTLFWLGGSDSAVESQWMWYSSTQPWRGVRWDTATNQPDNYQNSEDCMEMWHTGNVNDGNCNAYITHVCEKRVTFSFCDETWSMREGACFKLFPEKVTWLEALRTCQNHTATLASIRDASEQEYISGLYTAEHTWIGGFDLPTEGMWAWAGTTTPWTYTNWRSDQPNGGRNQNCAHLLQGGRTWNDARCNFMIPFLCKRETLHLEEDPVFTLRDNRVDNVIKFVCAFSSNLSDVDFLIQIYHNQNIVKELILTSQVESSLEAFTLTLDDQVGVLVKCTVTPCMPGNCSMRGSPRDSNIFVAKAQVVSGTRITVYEGSGPAYINVTSSVPPHLYCQSGQRGDYCGATVSIELIKGWEKRCHRSGVPISQAVFGMDPSHPTPCAYRMTSDTVLIPVKASYDGLVDRNQYRNIRVFFTVGNVTKAIAIIQMTVVDMDRIATCSSINDPHMTTFDKRYYDNYLEGEFILYRHKTLPYEVRSFFRRCNKKAACNCAVTVKSGNDVILVDVCGPSIGKSSRTAHYTVKMFLNGNLTAGTEVISIGGGVTYEVSLPTGTKVYIMTSRSFLNAKIVASTADFNNTEGLCGTFDGNRNNDLLKRDGTLYTRGGKQPNKFSLSWRVSKEESLYRGFCERDAPVGEEGSYCDCLTGETATCDERMEAMSCAEIEKRKGLLNGLRGLKLLTDDLLEDAEAPVGCFLPDRESFDHDKNYTQEDPVWPTPSNTTEDMARKMCEDYLKGDEAGKVCMSLQGVDTTPIVQGCVDDIKIMDNFDWAKESLDNLQRECITVVEKDTDNWDNTTGGPPGDVVGVLCVNSCSGNGNCSGGICECFHPWIGDDCSINSTAPPEVVLVGNEGPCDTVCSKCLSVSIQGENFADLDTLACHYRILNVNLAPTSDVKKVKAKYLNSRLITCKFPEKGFYSIAVSNDGDRISEYVTYILYDSHCHHCNSSLCIIRNDVCKINSNCFEHGFVNPLNQKEVCNVTSSTHQWYTLDVENVPRKVYLVRDISYNSVITSDGNIVVSGTGSLALESTPSGGKALVLSGNQYLSLGDLTDTCFGDLEKSALGMTITLSVKLTRSTATCYVLSNGGEHPSHYGYAVWFGNNYLSVRVNSKTKQWVTSAPDVKVDEFLRVQIKWSSQNGLQLIIGSEVKASTKTCASRTPSHYTLFKDVVIGGSSEKTKLCQMAIEYVTFVCASVNDTEPPSVPQMTDTVGPCRASSSIQTEAAVISTSVLTGILFPTVIVLCLILGCGRRRRKKRRHERLILTEQIQDNKDSKISGLNPVYLDDSGTAAYRHYWTGETPIWRLYRYDARSQQRFAANERGRRMHTKTEDKGGDRVTRVEQNGFLISRPGQSWSAYGFSNELTTTSYTHGLYGMRRGERYRAQDDNYLHLNQRYVERGAKKRSSSGGRSYDRTIWVSEQDQEDDIAVYQSVKKTSDHVANSSNLILRSEQRLVANRDSSHIHTENVERRVEKEKAQKTAVENVKVKSVTETSYRNVCQCCMAHGHFNAGMLVTSGSNEVRQSADSSCQTDFLPLASSNQIERSVAHVKHDQSTHQTRYNGVQGATQSHVYYVKSTIPATSTIQTSKWEQRDLSKNNEHGKKRFLHGNMTVAKAEEKNFKTTEGSGFKSNEVVHILQTDNKSERTLQPQKDFSENIFATSESGIEVQEGTLWLQSDGESDNQDTLSLVTAERIDGKENATLQKTNGMDETYEIRTEWIPDTADRKYVISTAQPILKEESYSISLRKGNTKDGTISRQTESNSFMSVNTKDVTNTGKNEKRSSSDVISEGTMNERVRDGALKRSQLISQDLQRGFVAYHDNGKDVLLQNEISNLTDKGGEKVEHQDQLYEVRTVGLSGMKDGYVSNAGDGGIMKVQRETAQKTIRSVPNMEAGSSGNSSKQELEMRTVPMSGNVIRTGVENSRSFERAQTNAILLDQRPNDEKQNSFFRTSTIEEVWTSGSGGKTRVGKTPVKIESYTEHSDNNEQGFASRFKRDTKQFAGDAIEMNGKHLVSHEKEQGSAVHSYKTWKLVQTDSSGTGGNSFNGETVFYKPGGVIYRYRSDGTKEYLSETNPSAPEGTFGLPQQMAESDTSGMTEAVFVHGDVIPENHGRVRQFHRIHGEKHETGKQEKQTFI